MEEGKVRASDPDPLLFLTAFKASPIGIAVEDLEGRPLFANPALCSMLGFSEEEMRKKHCVEFSPPEDAQKDWSLFQQLCAGSINHYQLEKRFFRRDGSLIWGRLSISLLGSGASRLVFAMVEDLSEKKVAPHELLQTGEKLGARLIQAREEERISIARELHGYIDSLTVVAICLDRFGQYPPDSSAKLRKEAGEARQQVKDIVTKISALSQRLHSSKLEFLGLAVAAGSLCHELSETQKVQVDFHCDGLPGELPREISFCLYHVLQEALQNAIQHSGSRRFEVSLSSASPDIHLMVRDWGTGFDPQQAMKGSGLGLAIMQERLKLLDGELSIESQPRRGATVHACVPVKG
jgi:PAS domain S-box-containing protein